MKFGYLILLLIGIVGMGFGAIMLLGGTLNFLDPEKDTDLVTFIVMIALLGLAPIGFGGWLSRFAIRNAKGREDQEMERMVLQLAEQRGGKLSAAELTAHSQLSASESGKVLAELHRNGVGEMQVSESGAIFYRFPGLDISQKNTAVGYSEDA